MSDLLHLLRTRRFLPLFITQFLGVFNDNAFKNAFLIWFTYGIAEKYGWNAPIMQNLAAGLFILPFFLFSATAGQLADKFDKAWISRQVKLIEIVLMALCFVFFYMHSVYGLLIILFLMGTHSAFFGPIKYSLLPEHLREDELIGGNGLIEGGTFLAILLGTIFGSQIINIPYGVEIFAVTAVTCAFIGWISSSYIPKAPVFDKTLQVGWNIAEETWKIIEYTRKDRTIWLSILSISWFWFLGTTFLTQLPYYTKEVIRGNESIFTLFLTLFSIGIGLGSVLCNRILKGKISGRLVPLGAFGMSVAIGLFSFSSYFYQLQVGSSFADLGILAFLNASLYSWGILSGLLLLAVSSGMYIVPLYTIIQHFADLKYLARIIAANNVINALFMVAASLIAVALYKLNFSVIDILLFTGIANIPVIFIARGVLRRRYKSA